MTPFWICAAIYVALCVGFVMGLIMGTPPPSRSVSPHVEQVPDCQWAPDPPTIHDAPSSRWIQ